MYRDPGQSGGAKPRIYEDDPRWNPKTMGNKRGLTPAQRRARKRSLRKQYDEYQRQHYEDEVNDPLKPKYRRV